MRPTVLGLAVCLLAHLLASAKTASARDHEAFPYQTSVSEVSKDGHPIHNRLTFDCVATDGASGRPPKKIDCVLVQQDLQEPSPPPSKEVLEKQLAAMTDDDKLRLCQGNSTQDLKDESPPDAEIRKRFAKACGQTSRAAVVAAVTDVLRNAGGTPGQTCTMTTIVQRISFVSTKKGVWVSYPDPTRPCPNVAITRTLRADPSIASSWNYTEVTVATPSHDSFCRAEPGTAEFTWRQAVTASQLGCRYVEM